MLSGPLLWGFMSGMDVPLFAALALAWLARWPSRHEAPDRTFFILGGLLGLARPDAVFLIIPAFILGLGIPARRTWWLFPLLGMMFPFLLQFLLTGSPQSASMDVKSVFRDPGFTWGHWLATGLSYIQIVIKGILGGGVIENSDGIQANNGSAMGFFMLPLALGLFVLGALPGAWMEGRERNPGPFLLLVLWTLLLVAAVSFTVPRAWHWHRYLIPVHALVLVGVAVGVDRAGRWVDAAWGELPRGDGSRLLGVLMVLLSLPGAAFFTLAYGRNCADIYFQHVELADRFNEGNPVRPGRLGTHDAGALAYFARGYSLVDLNGLVTESFRRPARLGAAGIWEQLERLDPGQRPDVLAVYPDWYGKEFLGQHRLVHGQRLLRTSIAGGNPLQVHLANWRLAGRGEDPRSPGLLASLDGLIQLAGIDVADVQSEEAVGYRYQVLDHVYDSILKSALTEDDTMVMEGGRLISGWEEFTIPGARAGDSLVLVTRTDGSFRIRVETNGDPQGIWIQEGNRRNGWTESFFVIPEGAITGEPVRIRLTADSPHHSAYRSFHYWAYRP